MTTLEKIRAEIEQYKCIDYVDDKLTVDEVLQIIDKYAEQEPSEDMTIAYLMGYYADKEPCEDAISREDAIQNIYKWFDNSDIKSAVPQIEKCLNEVSLATPSVQPKTGHWKRISMNKYTTHAKYLYECDKCGEYDVGTNNFCPNCGAKMVGLQESEDKE